MSVTDTQIRWDAFLEKIKTTFDGLMEKANVAMLPLFEQTDLGTTPFSNAWQGINVQAMGLIQKIEDTWTDQVEDAFLDAGLEFDSEEFIKERNKGYLLAHELKKALKSNEINLFAKAADQLFVVAKEILAKDFCCTQCKAKLTIKDNFFRSYYVNCDYCQTVNTFEPGTKVRNLEHFGVEAIAKRAALQYELNYDDALFKNYIEEEEVIAEDELQEIYKNQIVTYLEKRIAIIPDYQDRYEEDLAAKLSLTKLNVVNNKYVFLIRSDRSVENREMAWGSDVPTLTGEKMLNTWPSGVKISIDDYFDEPSSLDDLVASSEGPVVSQLTKDSMEQVTKGVEFLPVELDITDTEFDNLEGNSYYLMNILHKTEFLANPEEVFDAEAEPQIKAGFTLPEGVNIFKDKNKDVIFMTEIAAEELDGMGLEGFYYEDLDMLPEIVEEDSNWGGEEALLV